MKKLLGVTLLLGLMSAPAMAETNLGLWTCGGGNCTTGPWNDRVPNQTSTQIWATNKIRALLGCAPNTGNGCPLVDVGEWYQLHVNVRCGGGPPCAHALVRAKAGNIPTIGQNLEFTNVTFAWSCGIAVHMRNIPGF